VLRTQVELGEWHEKAADTLHEVLLNDSSASLLLVPIDRERGTYRASQ
jgi:hypothetical protein